MIFRMEIKRDYTVVNNGFLRDQTLSLKAKGLLAYMLSRPDDWQFSISGLSSQLMEGELAIKGTLKELMKCGYVQRERVQQPDGTFAYRYSVFEANKPPPRKSRSLKPHSTGLRHSVSRR